VKELNLTFQYVAGDVVEYIHQNGTDFGFVLCNGGNSDELRTDTDGMISKRRIVAVYRDSKGWYGLALAQLYYNEITSKIEGGWKPLLDLIGLYTVFMRTQKPIKLKIDIVRRRRSNG
jgi:hypothetical protein